MSNAEHRENLLKGAEHWNQWRRKNEIDNPQLYEAMLKDAELSAADLSGAVLSRSNLDGANLEGANLSGAILETASAKKVNLKRCNLSRARFLSADLTNANLEGANLSQADFHRAILKQANLSGVKAKNAHFEKADLSGEAERLLDRGCNDIMRSFIAMTDDSDVRPSGRGANLSGADLTGANFSQAHLEWAHLDSVDATGARFYGARLNRIHTEFAIFSNAAFIDAHFYDARLEYADFSGADMNGAVLSGASFVGCTMDGCDLTNARLDKSKFEATKLHRVNLSRTVIIDTAFMHSPLSDCPVYGVSAWDLTFEDSPQSSLFIAQDGSKITVDKIEVAQFIYTILHNARIRDVLNTVTSKTVLILGRFAEPYKAVLDDLKTKLRELDYVPVIFDFSPAENRNLTETVRLLASMARFVIADLTDPKSIPQELSAIIPHLPSVPVLPIILEGHQPYGMYEHWENYPWVAPVFTYRDRRDLMNRLETELLERIENRNEISRL